MGVFARLLGRSSDRTPKPGSGAAAETADGAVEAHGDKTGGDATGSDAEPASGTAASAPPDGTEAEPAAGTSESAGTATIPAPSDGTEKAGATAEADGGDDNVVSPDGVGIPKQQSADEAADSGTGDSSRT
ncbi:hypothetical protein [Streptomyces sp. HNM0574]|uniref:hypothetical protein n=1 Tax=Streptomyces sp. HNM0574 TaxID=2714954 RepID=UPI00146A604C|nr:hypothetical protein [Streptomyces sp. HNM0574]NLU65702.1 hypothetical protein [Streptomyces sp. HNM0574]